MSPSSRCFQLLALVVLGLAAPAQLTAADSGASVLYLSRVFEESRIIDYRANEMKVAANTVNETVQTIDSELERLEEAIQLYHPSQPQHRQQNELIEILKLRRKLFLEHHQPRLIAMEAELIKASYHEMREHLAAFAQREGLGLVILANEPQLASQRLRELQMELAAYTVLYHSDNSDVTGRFLTYLDEVLPPVPELPSDDAAAAPAGPAAPVISVPAE